jgi:membrane fusion protein, heavy metal efflux system
VAPYVDPKSQFQLIRATIANNENSFMPGMLITGDIIIDKKNVSVTVKKEAIEILKGKKVIFIKEASLYTAVSVSLGIEDEKYVEILRACFISRQRSKLLIFLA